MSPSRYVAVLALVPLLLLGCASSNEASKGQQANTQAEGTGSTGTTGTQAERCVFDRGQGRWRICRSSNSGHCVAFGEPCNPPPGK